MFFNLTVLKEGIKEGIESLRFVLIDLELPSLNTIIQWNKLVQHDIRHARARINCR